MEGHITKLIPVQYVYPFEKLEIWRISVDLVELIYEVTKSFPPDEKYGIVNQIRRASTSISANIAEGSGRLTNKERARFIQLAFSSLLEVLSYLRISKRLNFIDTEDYNRIRKLLIELSNKINAFHNVQLSRHSLKK